MCGPSRTSILTGRLPDNTRVWHNRNLFRDTLPDLVTLPEYFKNHGYHAQSLGKVFSGNAREAEQDPQSWSVPPLLKGPGWSNYALKKNQGTAAREWPPRWPIFRTRVIRTANWPPWPWRPWRILPSGNSRSFWPSASSSPTCRSVLPRSIGILYDPAEFDLAEFTDRTHGAPEIAYHEHRELGGYKDVPKDEKFGADKTRHLRHGYYACVSYADAQVGKLLDALERFGLEENTIVVFWGDHGYSLGEGDRWCKGTNFEMDTRTPLMFRFPGMPEPGVATEAMVEYVDIYPTVVELAGLPAAPDLDGTSFVPILNDPDARRPPVRAEPVRRPFKPTLPEVMGYSVRTQTHRYTRWVRWPSRDLLAEEFYDYTSSRSAVRQDGIFVERENVIRDPAYGELREQLSAMMDHTLEARTNVEELKQQKRRIAVRRSGSSSES